MDPRARRVRTALLSSAWTLAHEGRIESISVASICRYAGVSRQVLYKHFADRDEVLFTAVQESFLGAVGAPASDPLESVVAWIREHGELQRNLYPSQVAERLAQLLRDTLRPVCESALPDRVDSRLQHADIVSMLVGGAWELLRQIAVSGPQAACSAADLRVLLDLVGNAAAPRDSTVPAP